MNENLTQIVIVLDRSGSMTYGKSDMEGGLNEFIDNQRKVLGRVLVSLYQFDTIYETVFENRDISEVGHIELNPRGGTALLDAIGSTVNRTGQLLRDMKESERPSKVIFIIITDGEENSSKEFHSEQVNKLINNQRDNYSWQFVFIGADQDAIKVGGQYGLVGNSSYCFTKTSGSIKKMYKDLNDGVVMCRSLNQADYNAVVNSGNFFADAQSSVDIA